MKVGSITITYEMMDDGDIITGLNVDGDLPVVTQLGLLELAKDTILQNTQGEQDEYDGK